MLFRSEFISGKSLNQISKPYGISVNGIKKILRNFSYLGKIRFDKQISQGNHAPIISPDVFNQAQKILENKNKKVFIGLNTDNSNIYNGE